MTPARGPLQRWRAVLMAGLLVAARGCGAVDWFDPATAPFIPVPEIATNPNGGTTIGVLPVWVRTEDHVIRRIIAPDVLHNPYFGFGFHARMYSYPSDDEQWSALVGAKQKVEREFDIEYQVGRSRAGRWSFNGSLVYDRDGTPRFYGIGNATPQSAQTSYTGEQTLAQAQLGLNFGRSLQLLYTARARLFDVLPGTLPGIASIESRFGGNASLGTRHDVLNRLAIVYDTRDEVTIPRRGMKWVAYAGLASRGGLLNDSMYSEAGFDGRAYVPVVPGTRLVGHVSLRMLPSVGVAPFWALSSLGGGRSEIGADQPLRGYGAGRFVDRNSFSTSVELRRKVWELDIASNHVEIEVAPFADVGRVFGAGESPLARLHKVGGLAFRGIARPFVVGYVDIGFGSEGPAVFSGIYYPF